MAEFDLSFSEWMAGALKAALAEGEIGQRSVVLRWDGQKVEGLAGLWASESFEREFNAAMRSAAPLFSLCRILPTKGHSDFWKNLTHVPRASKHYDLHYESTPIINFYLSRHITAYSNIHIYPEDSYLGNERPDPWLIESMTRQAVQDMLLPSLAQKLNEEILVRLAKLLKTKTYQSLSEVVAESVSRNMSSSQITLLHSHNQTRGLGIPEWKNAEEIARISGKKLKISTWGEEPSYLNEAEEIEILCGDFTQILCLMDDIAISVEVTPTQVNLEVSTSLFFGPWKREGTKLLAGKLAGKIGTA